MGEGCVEVRGVDAAEWKQARAREPMEEEKENQCVLGLEMTTAWEKVKACCSVGPREKSGRGEGGRRRGRREREIP